MTKKGFVQFLALPNQDKREIFTERARYLSIPPHYVEKDFWVCFVLDALYNNLPAKHPRLLFKGGTALSKVFGLVRRFSEDVDLVVCREGLGFGRGRDPTSANLPKNKRKALFAELKEAYSKYMLNELCRDLSKSLGAWCRIESDDRDDDQQTLLIKYRTLYQGALSDYVLPEVKIEGGARSAIDPNTTASTTPYISEELAGDWSFDVCNLHVILPERTYLEKLLILHGVHCGYRDQGRLPKDGSRISRHYYDIAMLTETDRGKTALKNQDLFIDVREHNKIAFPVAWKKYDEAVPGSLHLVPHDGLRAMIEADFKAMQSMLFGEVPSFDWIMNRIRFAEHMINHQDQ